MMNEPDKIAEIAAQAATIAAIRAVQQHGQDEKAFWDETRRRLTEIEREQIAVRQVIETYKLGKLGARVIAWLAVLGAAVMTIYGSLHGGGK